MHLRDVLKVVGESELSRFPWGRNVVSIVNGFVEESYQLTLESKGADVDRAIATINEIEREMVLSAKVRIDGFVAPPVPSANDDVQIERNNSKTKSIAVFFFIGTLCLIALVMTFSISYGHLEGKPMDVSGLKLVFDAILGAIEGL